MRAAFWPVRQGWHRGMLFIILTFLTVTDNL
jgi:hypothetical protein